MPSSEPPSTVSLRVKVPPGYLHGGAAEEFQLGEVSTSSNLAALRQQIQALLPSHPSPERQRLLYGGRALTDNDQTIADALNTRRDPTQVDFVLHLIVRGESGQTSAATPSTPAAQPGPLPQNNPAVQQQQAAQNAAFQHFPQLRAGQMPEPIMPSQQAFAQAIAQGQQQRAAAGQNGMLPGMQNGNQPGQAPGPTQEGQQNGGQDTQGAGGLPQPPGAGQVPQGAPRTFSGQGFHAEGVRPDGQRFQIHHQTVNIPPRMPFFMHGNQMPPMPGAVPIPMRGPQPNAPSALDRARENVTEMRRMLDEMRNADSITEEQRTRIAELEDRTRRFNDYIDPFGAGNQPRSNGPSLGAAAGPPSMPPPFGFPRNMMMPPTFLTGRPQAMPSQAPNSSNVTAYLLSSPQGPQAIIYSPEGTYGSNLYSGMTRPTSTMGSTAATPGQPEGPQADPVADAVAQQVQRIRDGEAQGPEAGGPMQALVGHFWLLLRILIFAYFLLGSNMGWRRPAALCFIGLGFWLVRAGLFGEGGVLRRWWDGIVDVRRGQAPQNENAQNAAQGDTAAGEARPFPTPEEVANRLLAEREERENARGRQFREIIRPVERAAALFVASLWPGVGEAHVRAQEAEERRLAELEVERRRLEEEARKALEEEKEGGEKEEGEKSDGINEKTDVAGPSNVEEGSVPTQPAGSESTSAMDTAVSSGNDATAQ